MQLQTALAINLGSEGKPVSLAVSRLLFFCSVFFSDLISLCLAFIQVYYGFGEEKLMKIVDDVKVFGRLAVSTINHTSQSTALLA